jgi:hemin uptake protein HemP
MGDTSNVSACSSPRRPAPERAASAESGSPVRRIRSAELFADGSRVVIEHQGIEYRLQITRMGKLILTK